MTAALTAATEFKQVAVDYAAIAPMLIVVAGALVGVLVEAFAPRRSRHGIQVWMTALVLLAAFVALVTLSRTSPEELAMPLTPLAFPPLPLAAVVGLLVGAVPAYLTPPPPRPASRLPQRGAHEEVPAHG